MNTLTELKTFRGYPHFLKQTEDTINLVSIVKHSVGDGFTFGQNFPNLDKKQTPVFRVVEILEEREPKQKKDGHADGAIFYSFKVEKVIEDITDLELLDSNNS